MRQRSIRIPVSGPARAGALAVLDSAPNDGGGAAKLRRPTNLSLSWMRGIIVPLALAAIIPVLLFGGWAAYVTADRERREARLSAVATTIQVAERVSAALSNELEVAAALANSAALRQGDLEVFYHEARRLTAARPLWETVSLVTLDGTQVLNVMLPFGASLGPVAERESFERAIRDNQSVIGGIGPVGHLTQKRLVALRVPVQRDDEPLFVLSIGINPREISEVLRGAGAPDGWWGAIVDAQGNFVARMLSEQTEIGRPASAATRAAIARGSEGFYGGRTIEGVEVETVFRKLSLPEEWSVHFSIPAELLNRPVSRSFAALVSGSFASLALGAGLALLVARDLAQRRVEEHARASLALSVSEERGAVAVEAADLGTWRWDAERNEVMGSARMSALFDLPISFPELPESVWSTEQFLSALVSQDRVAFEQAVRRCFSENEALALEVRVRRNDGQTRWVQISGRCPPEDASTRKIVHGVAADVDSRKRAHAERQDLLRRLAEAQENERRRISRELHDQVGQTVTGLSLGLKGLEQVIDSEPVSCDLRDRLRWLQELANNISRDIHRAASDLRPSAIDDLGLVRALTAYARGWSKHFKVSVDVQAMGNVRRLPPSVETAVYRVVQEALTNVAKHAAAKNISIVLEFKPDRFRVLVEDDGVGFTEEIQLQLSSTGSCERSPLGVVGMRERLALLGGSLDIETAAGAGTTLFIEIPIAADPGPLP